MVTGTGSMWNVSGDFSVGNSSSGNNMTIANGGNVSNVSCWIGNWDGSNNTVLVTGTGSLWEQQRYFGGGQQRQQ